MLIMREIVSHLHFEWHYQNKMRSYWRKRRTHIYIVIERIIIDHQAQKAKFLLERQQKKKKNIPHLIKNSN